MFFARRIPMFLLASVPVFALCQAQAEDFRIANRVFLGDEKDPSSESTTLFRAGVVYDYIDSADETTVLDQANGRIVLLHTAHKIRAEITTDKLVRFTDRLREELGASQQPERRFLSTPSFAEKYDEAANQLHLIGDWIKYEAKTKPVANAEALEAYRVFSDWQSLLNVMMHPEPTPYGLGRLPFTKALVDRGLMPESVKRETFRKGKGKPDVVRAEHETLWRLTKEDQDRISETDRQLVEFELVTLGEYHRKKAPAPANRAPE